MLRGSIGFAKPLGPPATFRCLGGRGLSRYLSACKGTGGGFFLSDPVSMLFLCDNVLSLPGVRLLSQTARKPRENKSETVHRR